MQLDRLTDEDILHDLYARLHSAARLHPHPEHAEALRVVAEKSRSIFKEAGTVALAARKAAGISNPKAYAACSGVQSAAQRVVDAIENQVF